ncbi:MAG TPA: hypothetical protein VNO76_08160 [Thermoplasmata archaeon]|nr:hypothetical protein [Thermoplasmata archaeon]
MQERATLLLIILFGGVGFGALMIGGSSLVVQVVVVVAFALLGLLTVLLVRRTVLPVLADRTRSWGRNTFRELRRLTSSIVQGPSTPFPELAGPVEVYEWPEDAKKIRSDQSEVAHRLVDRLVPRLPEDVRGKSRSDVLARLIQEGEDLQSLGRLVKIDLAPYDRLVTEALGAARKNRFAEAILNLQLANERLRSMIESALAKELATLVSARARER